jgi:hypothetical protein
MAFLDNSGDIILDSVLTVDGRLRMAQGTFKITKFALGDDGINYALYNPNTGSAYTDLQILQTPVEVAHTQAAYINYGLLSITRNDMLYLPRLKLNELVTTAAAAFNKVFYLAVNSETQTALEVVGTIGQKKFILVSETTTGTKLIFETGLDGAGNDGITGTQSNQSAYLDNLNLTDKSFNIYVDSRFLTDVYGPTRGAGAKFTNQPSGQEDVSLPLAAAGGHSATQGLTNYTTYTINGIKNRVYYTGTSTAATTVSAIDGPRASATALNFKVDNGLTAVAAGNRSAKYSLYGSIGQDLFSDGNTYDYIDTLVYIVGASSQAQYQIPVRITRQAS